MGCPVYGGRTEKNRKIFVPTVSGGLRANCCGQCHEVQVRTGTECPGVRMYLYTTGSVRVYISYVD